MKHGIEQLADGIVKNLSQFDDVKLHLNEPCVNMNHLPNGQIEIKSKSMQNNFDVVIAGTYSKGF